MNTSGYGPRYDRRRVPWRAKSKRNAIAFEIAVILLVLLVLTLLYRKASGQDNCSSSNCRPANVYIVDVIYDHYLRANTSDKITVISYIQNPQCPDLLPSETFTVVHHIKLIVTTESLSVGDAVEREEVDLTFTTQKAESLVVLVWLIQPKMLGYFTFIVEASVSCRVWRTGEKQDLPVVHQARDCEITPTDLWGLTARQEQAIKIAIWIVGPGIAVKLFGAWKHLPTSKQHPPKRPRGYTRPRNHRGRNRRR